MNPLSKLVYIYFAEIIPPQKRSSLMSIFEMMIGVSGLVLTAFAVLSDSWKEYTNFIVILMTVSTTLVCLMPESNKWLHARHLRKEKPSSLFKAITTFLKSTQLIKVTAVLSFIFSASQMALFGLTLSVDSIAGSVLINFAILGAADSLANIILCILSKFISRRALNVSSFACLGVCCLAVGFIRLFGGDNETLSGMKPLFFVCDNRLSAAFFIAGKFFASITSSLVYLCGSESFPTDFRIMGTTLAQTVMRGMSVVLIVVLQSKFYSICLKKSFVDGKNETFWLPPTVFGILSTVAAFLCLLLPDHSELHLINSISEISKPVNTISFAFSYVNTISFSLTHQETE